MQWQSFQQTLRRDLQASWQKTALLGSLLLVGLWFWVPPLMRAVWGGTSEQATQAQIRQELPEDAGTQATRRAAAAADGTTVVYSWETVETLLDSDPLMQRSIMLRAPYSDPLHLMQIDLLSRWRATGREDRALFDALLASIGGIAQALQSTG